MNRKPVFIDLFAGCGGLSLGLERAGFLPAFVNEINTSAMETYLFNRSITNPLLFKKYHSFDIKEIVNKSSYIEDLLSGFFVDYKVKDVDLLVGGPPCQGYSGIGHRRSYSVDKQQLPYNHLYQDMAYVIHRVQPKIFMFENVRGLLNSRWTKNGAKGEIWEDVKKTFSSIPNYLVKHSLIYAKDYGIPQNRPRVILVGIREDIAKNISKIPNSSLGGFLPDNTNEYPNLIDILGDLVDPNYQNGGETLKYPTNPLNQLQENLRFNPLNSGFFSIGADITDHKYSKHSAEVLNKFRYMLDHDGIIQQIYQTRKFSQRLLSPIWSEKGPTITVTSMPDDYVHFSQPRILSVREWARLQFFPDWYKFKGQRTTGGLRRAGNPKTGNFDRDLPKYTQIGNAVPVRLAEILGKHFMKILDS